MRKNYYKTMREELAATVDFLQTLADMHPEIGVFQIAADKAKDEFEMKNTIEDMTDEIRKRTDDITSMFDCNE